jgi:hypothetical protein
MALGKYQFTLRWLLTVISFTAVVLGLSTPPKPPTDEERIHSQSHCFGPVGLFESVCLACILVPPYLAYGIRRRWRFSIPAIAVLAFFSVHILYDIRYEVGWCGLTYILSYCWHWSLGLFACLTCSAIATYLACRYIFQTNRRSRTNEAGGSNAKCR